MSTEDAQRNTRHGYVVRRKATGEYLKRGHRQYDRWGTQSQAKVYSLSVHAASAARVATAGNTFWWEYTEIVPVFITLGDPL